MAGREEIRRYIEYLKEQLAKTKSERRKKYLQLEIEKYESGRIPPMVCGIPDEWERNHPITGRKGKKKEE